MPAETPRLGLLGTPFFISHPGGSQFHFPFSPFSSASFLIHCPPEMVPVVFLLSHFQPKESLLPKATEPREGAARKERSCPLG